MQNQKRFCNLSIVGRYKLSMIANTVRRFVNNDVRSHILNLPIAEILLPHSDDATGNAQTIHNFISQIFWSAISQFGRSF